jgi:DNA (cytosine-5)-methyltransferase 1
VLENVPFMLQLGRGHALDFIIGSLERLGYAWAYRVIDSRAFGLPQRRERVFLVATTDGDPRALIFGGNETPVKDELLSDEFACGFYWTEGSRGLGWAKNAIPTLKGGSTIGIPSPPAIWLPNGNVVQPDIRDAERLQGFPADWTAPAERVAKRGMRWKLVGNAVTVNVAEWLGNRLRVQDGNTRLDGDLLKNGKSWPSVAWNCGDGRRSTRLSTWPVSFKRADLDVFLCYPVKPLSFRATAGFLSRFKSSTLSRPEGFIEALEAHLRRVGSRDRPMTLD